MKNLDHVMKKTSCLLSQNERKNNVWKSYSWERIIFLLKEGKTKERKNAKRELFIEKNQPFLYSKREYLKKKKWAQKFTNGNDTIKFVMEKSEKIPQNENRNKTNMNKDGRKKVKKSLSYRRVQASKRKTDENGPIDVFTKRLAKIMVVFRTIFCFSPDCWSSDLTDCNQ